MTVCVGLPVVVLCRPETKSVDNLALCYGSFSRPEEGSAIVVFLRKNRYGLLETGILLIYNLLLERLQ